MNNYDDYEPTYAELITLEGDDIATRRTSIEAIILASMTCAHCGAPIELDSDGEHCDDCITDAVDWDRGVYFSDYYGD